MRNINICIYVCMGLSAFPLRAGADEPHRGRTAPVLEEISRQRLTVESLVEIALQNNPTLHQARAETWKAYGRYEQAGLYPNPVIAYQGNEIGNDGSAGQQGAQLQQEIVTGNKLALSRNVAAWERQAAGQLLTAQEFRVANGTRQAFYTVLARERQRELAVQLVELTRSVASLAQARFEQEEGSRIELIQANIEQERAELLLITAENEVAGAMRRLRAVVGVENLDSDQLAGNLESGLPELTWETALTRLLTESPALRQARMSAVAVQAQIDRARAEPIPNVTVQAGPAYDFSSRDTIANVQVSIPVPIFNKNQGNITAAEGEWVRASHEIRRLELVLQRQLAEEFAKYQTGSVEFARYRDRIVPATEETLKLSRDAYQAGELPFLQILTVERTYIEARQQYIRSLAAVRQSSIAIDGLLLTDGLAAPDSQR